MTDVQTSTPMAPLSETTTAILGTIPNHALQQKVHQTVQLAFDAVTALGRIHLPQDHFEEGETARTRTDKHLDLAPYVLSAVAAINRLLAQMAKEYPPPKAPPSTCKTEDDFDLEFDLVDGPTGAGVGLANQSAGSVVRPPEEEISDTAHAIGSMIRSRTLNLAERLRFAIKQEESWPLLIELDDSKRRLTKAVQGLILSVLGTFSKEVRREEILPSYRSSVREAVALRSAVVDLTYHVSRINAALALSKTADEITPLLAALTNQMSRFSSRAAYRTLRPEDKRAFAEFLTSVQNLKKQATSMEPLRRSVEGFSKFLESLSAINHREVLVIHDRAVLNEALIDLEALQQTAKEQPEKANADLGSIVEALAVLSGRNPEMDRARRIYLGVEQSDLPPLDPPGWARLVADTLAGLGA